MADKERDYTVFWLLIKLVKCNKQIRNQSGKQYRLFKMSGITFLIGHYVLEECTCVVFLLKEYCFAVNIIFSVTGKFQDRLTVFKTLPQFYKNASTIIVLGAWVKEEVLVFLINLVGKFYTISVEENIQPISYNVFQLCFCLIIHV